MSRVRGNRGGETSLGEEGTETRFLKDHAEDRTFKKIKRSKEPDSHLNFLSRGKKKEGFPRRKASSLSNEIRRILFLQEIEASPRLLPA